MVKDAGSFNYIIIKKRKKNKIYIFYILWLRYTTIQLSPNSYPVMGLLVGLDWGTLIVTGSALAKKVGRPY